MHKKQLRESVYKIMGCMEFEYMKVEGLLRTFLESDYDNEIILESPQSRYLVNAFFLPFIHKNLAN